MVDLGPSVQPMMDSNGANGRIAFVRSWGTGADIYAMDPDGTDVQRVTSHPAADAEPAWSSDGTRLAFTREFPEYSQIYTVNGGGGVATRITSDSNEAGSPTWSPDDKKLAFRGCCGDEIFVVELADGTVTQLSHEATDGASGAYWPAWSPSGTEIAYKGIRYDEATETDSEALYLTDLDGDDVRRLTPDFFFDGPASWSPDGSRLAFAGRTAGDDPSDIYVVGADGSNLTRVMEDASAPGWSPDGTKVAFSSARDGDSEIYAMDPDGSNVTQLTHNDVHDFDPAWQPVEPSNEDPSNEDPPTAAAPAGDGPGFQPPSHTTEGMTFMHVTFVDGSEGEIVADKDLGIAEMTAQVYTAGGVRGIDRTILFAHGDASALRHEGPVETYEGADGDAVEVWEPAPDTYLCPNLVYGFGEWFVGVRTCQADLSKAEKETWARSLRGRIAEDGFLVLGATSPLRLQETGGHEGPELILGAGRANWIEIEPGRCDPERVPDEGDVRTMSDGTEVSFSRIQDGKSGVEYDWYASWCEDGLVSIQVSEAYEDFAVAAAEGFRLRDINLAP
jgi:Tol biopolymer transport system component